MPRWIPFIGFREEFIDLDGYPTRRETPWVASVFQISWFGETLWIWVGEVRWVHDPHE